MDVATSLRGVEERKMGRREEWGRERSGQERGVGKREEWGRER